MDRLEKNVVEEWQIKLLENKDLKKLWNFFHLYLEDPSQLVIQIKNEWQPYFNIHQLLISPSKIDFHQSDHVLAPFLCLKKSYDSEELERFENLKTIDDIIYKIEDFCAILPDVKVTKTEEDEEDEDED